MKNKKELVFTKVSMNLNSRSIENVNKLCELLKLSNKTHAVSISLELSRAIIDMKKSGWKIIVRKRGKEKEITLLY